MSPDARLALALFFVAVSTVALSGPMFLAHFRHALATVKPAPKMPPVAVLFVLETVKVALFSGLAVWAGARVASSAGLDAPVVRALLAGDAPAALRALAAAVPIAVGIGVAIVAAERFARRSLPALPAPTRAPMPPLVRATGVAYGAFAVELWFRWGVLASVAYALRGAGLDGTSASAGAILASGLAY